MVKLHVDKLTTGQMRCIVHHNYGRGTWAEVITEALRDGKEYARFQVQPDLEVRLLCRAGQIVAETRCRSTGLTATIEATPPPWSYTRG